MTYRAVQCQCGHRACKDWHVSGVASVQGVHFTEQEAYAVAAFLNAPEIVMEALATAASRHESEARFRPRSAKKHDDKAAAMRSLRVLIMRMARP